MCFAYYEQASIAQLFMRVSISLHHELNSDINGVIIRSWDFSDKDVESFGVIPTLHQRAYVDNLGNTGTGISASVSDLYRLCEEKKYPEVVKGRMKNASNDLVHRINSLLPYLPATEKVLELGKLSEERQKLLEEIDLIYSLAFYTCNCVFSKEFKKDHYYLKEDLSTLWTLFLLEQRKLLHMMKPGIAHIETKVDYFRNVVMPLVKNAQQHAYNPDNDSEGRLQNPKFYQVFGIDGKVDETNQEIILKVWDNGFGIRPEVQEKLFQRGVSTKTDNLMEHGIGLWAVKNFVEENDGRIWFESTLGKGTSFSFTIPYKEKVHFMYKQ